MAHGLVRRRSRAGWTNSESRCLIQMGRSRAPSSRAPKRRSNGWRRPARRSKPPASTRRYGWLLGRTGYRKIYERICNGYDGLGSTVLSLNSLWSCVCSRRHDGGSAPRAFSRSFDHRMSSQSVAQSVGDRSDGPPPTRCGKRPANTLSSDTARRERITSVTRSSPPPRRAKGRRAARKNATSRRNAAPSSKTLTSSPGGLYPIGGRGAQRRQ